MPELVRQHVAEHEPCERLTRPGDDTVPIEHGARLDKPGTLGRRQPKPEPPRSTRLVVQKNPARPNEPAERQAVMHGRRRDQLDALDAVIDLHTEDQQRATNIRRRRRMMPTRPRATRAHNRQSRSPCSPNPTRLATKTVRHAPMMAQSTLDRGRVPGTSLR